MKKTRYFLVNYIGEKLLKNKSTKSHLKIIHALYYRRANGDKNGIIEGDFLFNTNGFLKTSIIDKELGKGGVKNIIIRNIYEFKDKKDYDSWCS